VDTDLVLTHPSALSTRRSRAVGTTIALALLLVVAALAGWAGLYLAACVPVGLGLSCLSGLSLTTEERLALGAVIGALVVAVVDLALALVLGLGAGAPLLGLALVAGIALAAGWRNREQLGAELDEAARRWSHGEPWPLWLLLAVSWPFTLALLAQAYTVTDQGLVAGNPGVYADWAAHLTYAGSFAYGANFPPQFPIDPGHPLSYPFLIDFLAASLVPLGASLTSSLVLSSGLLGLAFPPVMYLAGKRLLGSRGAAAIAVPVFAFSGGLGFVFFGADLLRLGPGVLLHLPRLYTQDVSHNYQWLNPVLAWMIPQRSVLFGFSLTLLSLALLWQALRQTEAPGWSPFVFTGVVVGLTPIAHLHAYGTVVALAAFWALFSPRRQWAGFFVPAVLLGAPIVSWMLVGGAAHPRLQPWWLADTGGNHDGPIWFWLKNTGLLVPLMAIAFVWRGLLPSGLALHLAPIWLWFVVPNFVVFQPWDWDNTKFFGYWAFIGALPVGAVLARLLFGGLGARAPSALLGAVLAVALTLSGALDLARTLDRTVSSALFTDTGGIHAALWIRTHTAPHATFLAAPEHNEPVPTLGGRAVVAGYPGWLWTYGLADWSQRTQDVDLMLRGDPSTPALLRAYGVDYVVLGPQEINGHRASPAYWETHGRRVYSSGGYTVYEVV
jgi:hypothetical protein